MRPLLLAATALWAIPAAAAYAPQSAARVTGFASKLTATPLAGPAAWRPTTVAAAWTAITRSNSANRQTARWAYARALIGEGRGPEAFGVLEAMGQDEPALARAAPYRLARAAALVHLRRAGEALEQLSAPELTLNPEACLWRLRAFESDGQAIAALRELACARSALSARTAPDRREFILAASRAALTIGQQPQALDWLRQLPAADASANLLRGRALIALGQSSAGDTALAAVVKRGTPVEQIDAQLTRIEAAVARRAIAPTLALREVDRLRFGWRGDRIEERALQLSYRLSSERRDLRAALAAGSTLFNYFDTRGDRAAFILGLQRQLAATLDPANGLPLDQAAGLYWDYRDLAPVGAEGDYLVTRLAERLQEAGLYARAAELLEHQLVARTRDLAKGPLSAKVAALHILAGHPKLALGAIRASERTDYPATMRWERQRMESVALVHLDRSDEALAVLDEIPGSAALRGEIHWRRREWSKIETMTRAALPRSRTLGEGDQAIVLRHAVALAMLGREQALTRLRSRYAGAFVGLPSARAFDVLTGAIGSVDPEAMGAALASIPAASPAGAYGDLLDAVPAA